MLAAQFRTTGTRTMLAGECRTDFAHLSLQTAHRFPLAGECPLCGAEHLEDGAPATHVCCAVAVEVQRYYRPSWRR